MKTLKLLSILLIATLASCSSVRVNADYDKKATFVNYKTYAYLKREALGNTVRPLIVFCHSKALFWDF